MEMQPRSWTADRVSGKTQEDASPAQAAAAAVEVAAGRGLLPLAGRMPQIPSWEVEEQVEHMRRAALREAARQARRAAAERLETARRAEAAAIADSIARREEREIAEAQATILRQAARYAEAEMRGRRKRNLQANPQALPLAGQGRAPNHGQLLDGDAAALRQRFTPDLELGQKQAAQYQMASHAAASRAAAAMIGGVTQAMLDEPCWCEAERLIGTGYSRLEGALSRDPKREGTTDRLRSSQRRGTLFGTGPTSSTSS